MLCHPWRILHSVIHDHQKELIAPLAGFLESKEGNYALSRLQQTLGEIRRIETYHKNRVYHKKGKEQEA